METETLVRIKIGDVADEPPMFGGKDTFQICSDPKFLPNEIILLMDPDESGDITSLTVSDGTTDLSESFVPRKINEKEWQLTYAGGLKSFTGALEKLVLTATDSTGEQATHVMNVQICSCNDEGNSFMILN